MRQNEASNHQAAFAVFRGCGPPSPHGHLACLGLPSLNHICPGRTPTPLLHDSAAEAVSGPGTSFNTSSSLGRKSKSVPVLRPWHPAGGLASQGTFRTVCRHLRWFGSGARGQGHGWSFHSSFATMRKWGPKCQWGLGPHPHSVVTLSLGFSS